MILDIMCDKIVIKMFEICFIGDCDRGFFDEGLVGLEFIFFNDL